MPDPDPLDRLFDAVRKDKLKKDDELYEEMLEDVKEHLPAFVQEAIEKGAYIKPSDFAANPELDMIRQNAMLRAQLQELAADFNLAMGLLRAVVVTYGSQSTEFKDGHQIFLLDEVIKDRPHCVDTHIRDDAERHGTVIHVTPSDCDNTHVPPGHSVN